MPLWWREIRIQAVVDCGASFPGTHFLIPVGIEIKNKFITVKNGMNISPLDATGIFFIIERT